MTLEQLLLQMGLNVTSSFIYDWLSGYLKINPHSTRDDIVSKLESVLNIERANIYAKGIVEFLADSGDIDIAETKVFAEKATLYRAQGSQFTLRDETISETHSGSRIEVGRGASTIGTGSASVEQDENGNIRFSV